MQRVWQAPEIRPTMDIDMLGMASNSEAEIAAQFRDVLFADVEPDGLAFDPETIRTQRITKDADYQGIRVQFKGLLDMARINMQIDIEFGDIVHPRPASDNTGFELENVEQFVFLTLGLPLYFPCAECGTLPQVSWKYCFEHCLVNAVRHRPIIGSLASGAMSFLPAFL